MYQCIRLVYQVGIDCSFLLPSHVRLFQDHPGLLYQVHNTVFFGGEAAGRGCEQSAIADCLEAQLIHQPSLFRQATSILLGHPVPLITFRSYWGTKHALPPANTDRQKRDRYVSWNSKGAPGSITPMVFLSKFRWVGPPARGTYCTRSPGFIDYLYCPGRYIPYSAADEYTTL